MADFVSALSCPALELFNHRFGGTSTAVAPGTGSAVPAKKNGFSSFYIPWALGGNEEGRMKKVESGTSGRSQNIGRRYK